jgi:histidinol-phosphate aminotransferase
MTAPRLRDVLGALPAYQPGRRPPEQAGIRAYKISSNENPYPPLPGVLEAATAAAAEMNRYPDMFSVELIEAIATRFDVPPLDVAVGTGSIGVLGQALKATAHVGDEVVYPWRSFEAYPIEIAISGATAIPVALSADGRHDLRAMADAVTAHTRLILLCTPNNPTGPALRHAEVEAFLKRVPSDVLVVIDEAYVEFVRDPEAADGLALYRRWPNVCLLRTFSKAYGLAGLRVGFAIAAAPVAEALRKTAVPFGVSVIAQRAAVAALQSEEALLERVETLVKERDRVSAALRDQGWDIPMTEANFVWFPLGAATLDFAAACAAVGLSVRPFAGEGVRATIAEPEANDRLLGVAGAWRSARR